MGDKLWALDFDGVLCDSCGESALSGWKVTTCRWDQPKHLTVRFLVLLIPAATGKIKSIRKTGIARVFAESLACLCLILGCY